MSVPTLDLVVFDDNEARDKGGDAEVIGCGVDVCACLLLLGRVGGLEDEGALCYEDYTSGVEELVEVTRSALVFP